MIDLAINVSQNKNWKIITLKGELDDYQSRRLTQTFSRLIDESNVKEIVLDLNEVSFVDSVGLGTIAIAGKKLIEKSGQLRIVCSQDTITKMFAMSGIVSATKKTIQLFQTLDSAVC